MPKFWTVSVPLDGDFTSIIEAESKENAEQIARDKIGELTSFQYKDGTLDVWQTPRGVAQFEEVEE
jgi:uncharacterized protein (UPF0212 family)